MHPAAKRGWGYFGLAVGLWIAAVANVAIIAFLALSNWYLLITAVLLAVSTWTLWAKSFPLVLVGTLEADCAKARIQLSDQLDQAFNVGLRHNRYKTKGK